MFYKALGISVACIFALAGALNAAISQFALEPDPLKPEEIVILANSNVPESVALAKYYAQKRAIPAANIVALPMPVDEEMTWNLYVMYIFNPLHKWLADNDWIKEHPAQTDEQGRTHGSIYGNRVGYIVICQGVPLRISDDSRLLNGPNKEAFYSLIGVKGVNEMLLHSRVSIDSEIAAMPAESNPVVGFVANPLFRKTRSSVIDKLHIFKTSRLGGVDYESARSLIDSAIEGEKNGIQGRVYIDKGGPFPKGDMWMDGAARAFIDAGWDVSIDNEKDTLRSSVRFDAPAFYFGWYAYSINGPFAEPDMKFPAGSIAMHLFSFSASTLKSESGWSAGLVKRGVAGTVGNVFEPSLELTHDYNIIAQAMLGGWTFCDATWASMPVMSWQGVVLGDPLYRPMPWMAFENTQLSKPKGEYPSLQRVIKMEKQGRMDDAIAATRETFAQTHGYASALKLAQLLHSTGSDAEVAAALSFMADAKPMDAGARSVALESARFLFSLNDYDATIAILNNLWTQKGSPAFKTAIFDLGCEVAAKSGNAEYIKKWHKETPSAN